jgi:hypothetical protein
MKNRNRPESSQVIGAKKTPITSHRSLVTLILVMACAGCQTIYPITIEANYLTYDIPFTDTAAQAALQNAGKICAERKQDAIMTTNVCSLKQCFTSFQCVSKDGSTGYEK